MQQTFSAPIVIPSNWEPPFVGYEDSGINLDFALLKSPVLENSYMYVCKGCLQGGGDVDDIFITSQADAEDWPVGDGVPRKLAVDMLKHARQHEVIWRWTTTVKPKEETDEQSKTT